MIFDEVSIKDVKQEIGELIKATRKKNRLSQAKLAKLLGISRITIQNLESGKNFTIDTLLKVLRHFELLNDLHENITNTTRYLREAKSLYQ